jgi:glycosyltransferase involved in cell wall biosynthesis
MKVVYFQRKPRAHGNFSIERYFNQVRKNFNSDIKVKTVFMPFESIGIWRRIANTVYCCFHQGDVNHITGDINYVGILLRKKRTILTILDCGLLHDYVGFKQKVFKYFWFTLPIKRASLVTAISEATKMDLLRYVGCPSEKVSIIYVSVDSQFRPFDRQFNELSPRILQIGTAPNKNLRRLIPALKDIECTLVIVGKLDQDIKNLIRDNKIQAECLEWKLSDEEILDQYKQCDVLSFVSTLEGFGMPIVEANAIGRVVITSNVTSMPEIADNAALIVDPFDANSIRQGFLKIIHDSNFRAGLIKNGFSNHVRFDPRLIANEYSELYYRLYNLRNFNRNSSK